MKATLLFACCWLAAMQLSMAQGLTLTMPQKLVNEDDAVAIDILTLDFDSIVSTQFALAWDPNIINFEDTETVDLDLVAVGTADAANGSLRISWFDIDGEGRDLTDGQVFLRLNFTAIGEVGDKTTIEINGDSLEVQIFKATDTPFVYEEIVLTPENGSVEIVSETNPLNTFNLTDVIITDVPCAGSSVGAIQVTPNQDNVSFQWNGPNGFTSSQEDIENLIGGEYFLTVFDSIGIVLLDTTFMILQPLSTMMIDDVFSMPSACDDATGSVEISINGGTAPYLYTLEDGNQFNESSILNLSIGNYPVTISDANGCMIISEFTISQLDTFAFSLGQDINACTDAIVNVDAGNFAAYQWSDLSTNGNIDIAAEGQYSVTVTNNIGCTATDTITINYVDEVQLQVAQDDMVVCPGDSIVLSVSGGVSYEWIDPTGELMDTQGNGTVVVRPTGDNIYTVISESDCGTGSLDIPVAVFRIDATAGENVCTPTGQEVGLNASGGDFYYWSGSEYPLSSYDIPNPTVSPEDSTQYFVMIIDKNECTTFDTVTVFVADDPSSFIPHINFISPNGDGQNDVLDFGEIAKFGTNTFRVFNRWGKIVYEKINYQSDSERFSGIYNTEKLPAGNYYYILSFANDQQIKQTLTIVDK